MCQRFFLHFSGDVHCIGGNHDLCGGHHEYIEGCSVHWRNIIIHGGCHDLCRF